MLPVPLGTADTDELAYLIERRAIGPNVRVVSTNTSEEALP
jgi:hypothetical protein